jgi:hypothetical protein
MGIFKSPSTWIVQLIDILIVLKTFNPKHADINKQTNVVKISPQHFRFLLPLPYEQINYGDFPFQNMGIYYQCGYYNIKSAPAFIWAAYCISIVIKPFRNRCGSLECQVLGQESFSVRF